MIAGSRDGEIPPTVLVLSWQLSLHMKLLRFNGGTIIIWSGEWLARRSRKLLLKACILDKARTAHPRVLFH